MVEVLCQVKFSTRMHGGESVKINRYHLKAIGATSCNRISFLQSGPLQSNWRRFKATGAASKQLEPLQSNWSPFKATGAPPKQLESLQSNWSPFKATGAASKQLEPLQSNWGRFKATGATSKRLEPLQNNRGTGYGGRGNVYKTRGRGLLNR
jgi:hypothetical protein